MSTAQRIILTLGSLAALATAVYPRWVATLPDGSSVPVDRDWLGRAWSHVTCAPAVPCSVAVFHVDWMGVLFSWLLIAIATAALFLAARTTTVRRELAERRVQTLR